MTATLDELLAETEKTFDPWAAKYHLRGPVSERKNMYYRAGYFGEIVSLELLVEFDYFFVYASPFLPGSNDELVSTRVAPDGHVRKMFLGQALDRLHISGAPEEDAMKKLGGSANNFRPMIDALATLLDRVWPEIATHAAILFPDAKPRLSP